ncbi:23S rRNA (cytidine1920-2'-O)/16S rRNA (cytidine1409-2'-O)-methyltransferase [Caldanaerobius fijiensis DSM 17918]|uniref:23S rRNA (Cytidine1920-2'-O)/16S rRNA (Cytidine1409-2'-O)-methyltransferase n=2 Tax=Caldanaerobius TaxID=862261 RepID=A0A1M4U8E4_9THEO|nr:TlyA family RNA methyltransferase [Caldanaerobius fijiensis]SHE52954.1 23S rRNA (cytidine1920-2'-O)/16S rRNA (cytidine1409-2'-O)-methyltransferase [Caldanaerobius fijiensis DSM 17918]
MEKVRLDVLLVSRGYYESREKAQANIKSGNVYVDGIVCNKPGTKVDSNVNITIKGDIIPYVSRGGLKLERALKVFNISVEGKVAMDIGASTGGFTDCLLQNGAAKVYAIDAGYAQLDRKLRNDKRVVCMEKTNARYLKRCDIPDPIDIVTIDVSFISVKKIIPVVSEFITDGDIISLVKPQFEAGQQYVGKKGVVKDPRVHEAVLKSVIDEALKNCMTLLNLTYSPIRGPEGNIEFFIHLKKGNANINIDKKITDVVKEAHRNL